ncbi:transcription termination factor Rho [Corynebacterium sp. UBA2622]|uniref:transcription termination factor Rho n=1 Tax=Corynebacterium sp. UBA2622 TaxID=1946393 RepID=UPI0025BDCB91|nr:transcription termination factor Rho [Corynebacterium sp. UBA2622]
MTEPGTTAAGQNLAALKIPELRKIAADQGLKGLSGLRKGELIQAITTGIVPRKDAVAAPAGDQEDENQGHEGTNPRRRAARRSAGPGTHESTQGAHEEAALKSGKAADAGEAGQQLHDDHRERTRGEGGAEDESGDETRGESRGEEQRYESRSAARRARRYRARQGGENTENTGNAGDTDDSGDAENRGHAGGRHDEQRRGDRDDRDDRDNRDDRDGRGEQDDQDRDDSDRGNRGGRGNRNDRNDRGNRNDRGDRNDRNDRGGRNSGGNGNDNRGSDRDDSEGGNRRGRRNRRNRNRNRNDNGHNGGNNNGHNNNDGGNQNHGQDFDASDLQEVAGIADVVDNNTAFIRTTGYHQSSADVFVNNKLVRQCGLRSGDAVIGQVRANGQGHSHGSGRNKQRYNQLVRIDSINGMTPEEAKQRKEFHKLTPLYPNKRLRLETEPNILTTRVIDLVMPIGKGQRALIVSPPKAGKTTILQNIANAIATNNPECYLMVVLVDERPEEVTDMQRSVKGEVISSTFDRPPSEHTAVAELAIERAKRLVEMGQDVVVLLDSITRLGRAYNNSSPASGRILSGGVDSNALYPPKRFLGAARNIEEGGSLTIIATAMVETGSAGDTVIFEEFKGTGNAELKLDRRISERRVFPAVDVNPSGTRKDELLMTPEEARIMHKLRRILSALDPQQSIDMLIKQLKKTKSNGEFLMGVAQSAPMVSSEGEEEYS